MREYTNFIYTNDQLDPWYLDICLNKSAILNMET